MSTEETHKASQSGTLDYTVTRMCRVTVRLARGHGSRHDLNQFTQWMGQAEISPYHEAWSEKSTRLEMFLSEGDALRVTQYLEGVNK